MIRLWANINNNNIIYFKLATVVADASPPPY